VGTQVQIPLRPPASAAPPGYVPASAGTNRDNITALAALLGYGSKSAFPLEVTCQKWQRLTHKGGEPHQ